MNDSKSLLFKAGRDGSRKKTNVIDYSIGADQTFNRFERSITKLLLLELCVCQFFLLDVETLKGIEEIDHPIVLPRIICQDRRGIALIGADLRERAGYSFFHNSLDIQ